MSGDGEGRREQFDRIAVPLLDQVYTTALYLARNPDDAQDLVQETYLRAFRFWDRFTVGTNCKAWMLTILHNVFRNRYRDRQRERRTIEYDESFFEDDRRVVDPNDPLRDNPEEEVLARLLDSEVEAALKKLPEDFLTALVLVDIQELTYEEAAAVMECPVGTVRSRLSRARRLLYRELEGYARERGLISSA